MIMIINTNEKKLQDTCCVTDRESTAWLRIRLTARGAAGRSRGGLSRFGSNRAAGTIGEAGGPGASLRCVELPTWLVAAAVYGGWLLLTLHAGDLPWWIVAPALGCIIGWHNSLQHEIIHGHPTGCRAIDDALGMPPLGLWMPFHAYRRLHLRHHRVTRLTDPGTDPESYYFTHAQWRSMAPVLRRLMIFNNTLLGRLAVGPAIAVARYWSAEIRCSTADGRRIAGDWLPHLALVALLAWWVAACGMPFWLYLLAAYIGLSFTLHRSFHEHRPARGRGGRSATVDASPFWRLLYLGNNFHALHHRRPDLPWYRLRQAQREGGGEPAGPADGFAFRGYGEILLRYLFRPKDAPVHPFAADSGPEPADR